MIFIKWTKGEFRTQRLDITPKKILSTEAWKDAASGILGKKTLFSLVTICNSWAAGAPWPLLKSAEFHNHVCPGLNVGYVIGEHLKTNHGLRNGEQYVFLGVPPICALDSFQMMFDATSGKSLTFVKAMSRQKVKQYSGTLWFEGTPLPPLIVIAMRVNKKSNSCEGVVLGMDWQRLFADAHIKYQELAPKGGKSNPLFFISRARLSIHMASMSMSQKLKYVKEIKRFFGQASLAQQLTREGVDPYAVIQTL
jgi:formylmethanofuran dehydrogenase subunit E-like metal-binding protein